jgi:hypothetical protein
LKGKEMQIQKNDNQAHFGALAFKKPLSGQNAHAAAQELATTLGVKGELVTAPYQTTNAILLKFKDKAEEFRAITQAKLKDIAYSILDDNFLNNKNAKQAMKNLPE